RRGQASKDCEPCHDERSWKTAPRFNHQATGYPLLGKHRKVGCAKCHPSLKDEDTPADAFPKPVSNQFLKYAPVAHKECLNCHEDPHKGSFGPRCQSCHGLDGWKVITNASKEREFHEKTRY